MWLAPDAIAETQSPMQLGEASDAWSTWEVLLWSCISTTDEASGCWRALAQSPVRIHGPPEPCIAPVRQEVPNTVLTVLRASPTGDVSAAVQRSGGGYGGVSATVTIQ